MDWLVGLLLVCPHPLLLDEPHLDAWQTNPEEVRMVLVLLLEHLLPQPANRCCLRHVANGCCITNCC
jgi:hypothetical protein